MNFFSLILCICFIAVLSAVAVMGFPSGSRLSVQQSSHAGCDSKKKDSVHYK